MYHLIRDPVHRTIPLSSDLREVVSHPLFQRLRRIRQTAFLNLVFPGATHDRFSHSLGAMHMAALLFDHAADDFNRNYGPKALQPDQRDYFRRLVRLAALLHDLGHGPFSHSLEGLSSAGRPIYPKREDFFSEGPIPNHWIAEKGLANNNQWLSKEVRHEELTIGFIAMMANEEGRIAGILAQDVASILCEWVSSSPEFENMDHVGPSGKWSLKNILKSTVSGELDCDRMDYLLRDSHFSGVPYGQYDKEMLLENVVWRKDPKHPKNLCIAIRPKALRAFEDFLISRYHMFLQLYSHKTVVGFDIILENALAELPNLYIHPELNDYASWSDEWLLRKILENRACTWGTFIKDRIPLKHLFTIPPKGQKEFKKFRKDFEISPGSTAWFPSLRSSNPEKDNTNKSPKLWWRNCISYLTKENRGNFPLHLDCGDKIIPLEEVSLLLKSNYTRRFEMTHVFCLRNEEKEAREWLSDNNFDKELQSKASPGLIGS